MGPIGGSIKLINAGPDYLKVRWIPPAVVKDTIDKYDVWILMF